MAKRQTAAAAQHQRATLQRQRVGKGAHTLASWLKRNRVKHKHKEDDKLNTENHTKVHKTIALQSECLCSSCTMLIESNPPGSDWKSTVSPLAHSQVRRGHHHRSLQCTRRRPNVRSYCVSSRPEKQTNIGASWQLQTFFNLFHEYVCHNSQNCLQAGLAKSGS